MRVSKNQADARGEIPAPPSAGFLNPSRRKGSTPRLATVSAVASSPPIARNIIVRGASGTLRSTSDLLLSPIVGERPTYGLLWPSAGLAIFRSPFVAAGTTSRAFRYAKTAW